MALTPKTLTREGKDARADRQCDTSEVNKIGNWVARLGHSGVKKYGVGAESAGTALRAH